MGWKDILVRSYYSIEENRLLALAAGVVFYSLVALIPALAASVSSYALFSNASTIAKHLSLAADIVIGRNVVVNGVPVSTSVEAQGE